ncbi:MAG: transposase [Thaumarchaeota archaeon]|nr:transposase [Nitrososphaerota archaeon]
MVCKTYQLKIDRSYLSKETLNALRLLFVEAKWFYNATVAAKRNGDRLDYRMKEVLAKGRNGEFEVRHIKHLSAQMRQEIIDRAKDNIRGLSKLKRKGYRVGALKFKSRIESIPLKQYGMTHRIKGNRIQVQNVKQPLNVMGLEQIPEGAELTSATMEQRNGDYYFRITTFQPRSEKRFPLKTLGIDFGIDKQLTLSNGLDIREGVVPTKRIRRIHRELSRKKLHGKNWFKTTLRLNKKYDRISNQRRDIRNKLVSKLVSTYETIKVQDDCIRGWQTMWGRRIQASAIGGIMSALKERAHTLVEVPRFIPTTRTCSHRGSIQGVGLEERVYQCHNCGLRIDRNLNSAINILSWNGVPAECREFTPVDMKAAIEMLRYFNRIPNVSASLVDEAGSPRPSVGGSSLNLCPATSPRRY